MRVDSLYIRDINHEHDYLHEIGESHKIAPDSTISNDGISFSLSKWIYSITDWIHDHRYIIGAIGGVLLLAIIYIIIKNMINARVETADEAPSGMGSDTIYGHKWDEEISECMSHGRYGEAVVLAYLRWLARLDQKGAIVFAPHKTPGMMLQEAEAYYASYRDRSGEMEVERARILTDQYLRIRYGHKEISAQEADRLIKA